MFPRTKTTRTARKSVRIVTPTPTVPIPPASPSIHRGPADVPVIQPGEILPYGRVFRLYPGGPRMKRTASRRFRRTTIRSPATSVFPPSSPASVHLKDALPSSDLPLKKRARCDTLSPATTDTTESTGATLPCRFEVGESSRAAAARLPTTATLETRLDQHHELIDHLRDELPEIRDRAQMTQEEQGRQAHELALVRERLADMGRREDALQLRIEHLEEIVVMMDREIRRLRGGPGGAPGGA